MVRDGSLEAVDWARFEGPPWYRPDEVPVALRALAGAVSPEAGRAAYDAVLFAIGNNHAGRLYPAAAAAVPFVVEVATTGHGYSRYAALDILIDVLSAFEAEDGFGALPNGRPLMHAVAEPIVDERGRFAEALTSPDGELCRRATELLEVIDGWERPGSAVEA